MQINGNRLHRLILCLSTWITSLQAFKVMCKFDEKGNSGTLTCTFNVNIGREKYDFSVLHYELEDDVTPEIVVACIWMNATIQPKCEVKEGYQFDAKTVTDKIVVHVQNLEKEHEGWYACQVIPPLEDDNMTEPCKYRQTGERATSPVKEDRSTQTHILIALLVIIGVAITAGAVIFAVVKIRRRRRQNQKNSNHTEWPDDELAMQSFVGNPDQP